MLISNADLQGFGGDLDGDELGYFGDGELGWGFFRKIGRGFKKVGKGIYKVGKVGFKIASLPAKAALKVANVTSGLLCKGPAAGAAGTIPVTNAFCKAVKLKDYVNIRRLLPAATSVASKVVGKRATNMMTAAAKAGLNGPEEMGFFAGLEGADPEELSFALGAVDPSEIGAAVTKDELIAMAPAAVAVGLGLFLLTRR